MRLKCIVFLNEPLNRYLLATYTSHLQPDGFSYELSKHTDERGWLAEFIKSRHFGQIFISKTKPGVSRGNHWHNTKVEKFLVVQGAGEIAFRQKQDDNSIIRYEVNGENLTVLDIPVGYVHAITNKGTDDMITLFWASEVLDTKHPDTIFELVNSEGAV